MAIAYNSTSVMSEDSTSLSTVTLAHTCNALDKKLVVIGTGRTTISGITYNGVSMTKVIDDVSGYQNCSVYYLDNPATGAAHNIVVTFSAATTFRAIVGVGISGCATGIGASATSSSFTATVSTLTTNITTTKANSDILDCFFNNNATQETWGAGESQVVVAADFFHGIAKKSTTTAGANSVTTTTSANSNFVVQAVEIPIFVATNSGFLAFM